jgi:hypothetical protein
MQVRKNWSIGQKLAVSLGVVLALTCLLTITSFDTARRLGSMLDRALNENAKMGELIGAIRFDLQQIKGFSTTTQFAYAISGLLKVDVAQEKSLNGLSECGSCHSFGSGETQRREFAELTAAAARHAEALAPLVGSDQARGALETIRGAIGEWQGLFDQFLALAAKKDFGAGHALITDRLEPLLARTEKATQVLEHEQKTLATAAEGAHRAVLPNPNGATWE